MNYYIGIDGGGTKTHCLLCSSEGKVLFETFGGPSNFLMIGTEEVCETVYNLIAACLQSENITWSDIASVVLGTTGAGRRSDAETFEKAFAEYLEKKEVSLRDFHVESDARAALEGAFSGNPGSILIAGTGSIMFGKKQTGEIVRVGGFGRFIGDEGSGFMLGKKGLIAAAKQFDGRGPETVITGLIYESFNISSPEVLITEIYAKKFDIASAAPLVLKAAESNDEQALRIVEEEAEELLLHIGAMYRRVGEEKLPVAFIGGILSNDTLLSRKLRELINEHQPDVTVKQPDHSPAYGAVLMAMSRTT